MFVTAVLGLALMFGVSNNYPALFVVAAFAVMASGCCTDRTQPTKSCPPYISQRTTLQTSAATRGVGVVADFADVGSFETVQRSLLDSVPPGDRTAIRLDDVICGAARNSQLADLIDAQRHALKCRVSVGDTDSIDRLLQGEALEQRNKSAGDAAKLFLGLVEVELQRELLVEGKQHLDELAETVRVAADEGMATADGENELAAARLVLKSAVATLNSAAELSTVQLNALINIDSESLMRWQPVYELRPSRLDLDFVVETETAATMRPGICALQTAMANGLQGDTILEILGQSVLGQSTSAGSQSLTERIMRRMLRKRLSESPSTDVIEPRREQLARVVAGRQDQARIEARKALIKIQSSIQRLAIANEKVDGLSARARQLAAKQTVNAEGAYLAIHRNWHELQATKSERVSAAVAHESAVVELLQAQGILVQECGLCLSLSQ